MNAQDIRSLIVLVILLTLSAYFSSTETALTTVNRIRIRTLADEGKRRAKMLMKVLDQPEKMLSVILIGNNIVNLSASSISTTLAMRLFGSRAVGLATGILTLLVLVFGEISPKTLATRKSEQIALFSAPAISVLMVVLTPAVIVVNRLAGLVLKLLGAEEPKKEALTEEEIRTMVEVSHEEGIIENEERRLINNVFDFGDTRVRDVMVPRIDMTFVTEDADYDELISIFRRDQYTRIPVCRETPDEVTGIINIKDLLLKEPGKEFRIRDYEREPLFTYESKRTAELWLEMRRSLANIAIVLDEYGATAGLVTMEDLLEEIVGEIRDEYDADEEKDLRRIRNGEYLVNGGIRLDDLNRRLELKLSSEDYESLGGLVMGSLGHLPEPGEEVDLEGVRIAVEKVEKNRVTLVRIWVKSKEKDAS